VFLVAKIKLAEHPVYGKHFTALTYSSRDDAVLGERQL
jgi:hypothetical protein